MSSETLTAELIEQEIEESGEITKCFNNFILRFDWKNDEAMTNRRMIDFFQEMDMANGDLYPIDSYERSQYSELFLSQTPRQFFAAIDDSVESLGISTTLDLLLQKRWELQRKRIEVNNDLLDETPNSISPEAQANQDTLNCTIKPVYIQMRLKGYNHADLTL